jgi:DNA-binding Xre family transcriptional regulator
MIEFRIRELAHKKGIENAHQLQKAMDIPAPAAYRLWTEGRTKIEFQTLDRLCEFFQCQPGDLLAYSKKPRRAR